MGKITAVVAVFEVISVLGEYVVATATNLDGTYTDNPPTSLMVPGQISEYLAIGSSWNAQVGYVTKSGYGVDFRYSMITPEFDTNANSVVSETTGWTVGASKYFKKNALKIQAAISSVENETMPDPTLMGQLLFQVIF